MEARQNDLNSRFNQQAGNTFISQDQPTHWSKKMSCSRRMQTKRLKIRLWRALYTEAQRTPICIFAILQCIKIVMFMNGFRTVSWHTVKCHTKRRINTGRKLKFLKLSHALKLQISMTFRQKSMASCLYLTNMICQWNSDYEKRFLKPKAKWFDSIHHEN